MEVLIWGGALIKVLEILIVNQWFLVALDPKKSSLTSEMASKECSELEKDFKFTCLWKPLNPGINHF